MAITIDWYTKVISVPKADLTLIQASPTEIRELNLNWFRLELKELEADIQGMPYVRTHNHFTEVTLGGLTFARVVEIINDYTVTFEDGQYAVNLVGANSNVGDVVNVNQVSVRSANSAGLISSPDIEYASFNGGVTIDQYSGNSGTVFPRGTLRMKVDNITDALLIAQYRGFNKLYFHSNYDIDAGSDLSDFIIVGESHVNTELTILDSADVSNAIFIECKMSGILDGGNTLVTCMIGDLDYVYGHIHDCGLLGTITLAGDEDAYFGRCHQTYFGNEPVIDMGGSGQNLVMTNFTGKLHLQNLDGGNSVGIGMDGGQIILDKETVTNGVIHVSGVGVLMDSTGEHLISGIWNGNVIIINELISTETTAEAVWGSDPSDFRDRPSFGKLMYDMSHLLGLTGQNTKWSNMTFDANHNMTGARITYYSDKELTQPHQTWDIIATYNGDGELTSYQMVESSEHDFSEISAYLRGLDTTLDSQIAYLEGVAP